MFTAEGSGGICPVTCVGELSPPSFLIWGREDIWDDSSAPAKRLAIDSCCIGYWN